MVFSSLEFLFIFLPAFLGVYYITPPRHRNLPLLVGSIAFYAYGARTRPWILLLFLALAGLSFVAGQLMERRRARRRGILVLCLLVIFGCLLGFKYAGLFAGMSVLLPLGLSFYSFQMAAYLMDVHARRLRAERSFYRLLCAFLLFPKLISGPLMPYDSLAQQLDERSYSWERFHFGLQDFLLGLSLKCLLADQIGGLWRQLGAIGYESVSTPLAWLGLVSFALQLYFDFYGYSLMAIGLGRMLGLRLPKNFVLPYSSRSVTEFWRRWHITLGRWFVDYVYIPLGGSRHGRAAQLRNMLVVWILTGIWHGSTPNFLLWGLYIFCFMAIEKLWLKKFLERSRIFSHGYLILVIMLSWAFFAITDLSQLGEYLGRLFPFFGAEQLPFDDFWRLGKQFGLFIALGIVVCSSGFHRAWDKLRQKPWSGFLLLGLFWLAVYYLSAGLNDPFLYFSF